MATDTYTVGGETVNVSSYIGRRFIATAYGVSVKVAPGRKWWCAWLCKRGTVEADSIDATAELILPGGAEIISLSGSCTNCKGKTIKKWYYHSPSISGPGVDATRYAVRIRVHNDSQSLVGSFILN